ncbi:unnamed protein product [Brassica oleracea]
MDLVFTMPPSKRWLENGLTVDSFLVEALQNPCHRLTRRFPVVKTAVSIDGRFEHIVLSCNEHQTTPSFGSNEKLSALNVSLPPTSFKSFTGY